jgi:uncharacterized MnhB-related membrane protein
MTFLQALLLVLVAAGGTAVVLVRKPERQAFVVGADGLLLSLLFFALQAPDVALSELAIGAVAIPLMILVTISKAKGSSR